MRSARLGEGRGAGRCYFTWVHLEGSLEVEASRLEEGADVDGRLLAALDRREAVDGAEPRLDAAEVGLAHQVHLVEQQPVREGDL